MGYFIKKPIAKIGYDFVAPGKLLPGQSEYDLRYEQSGKSNDDFRSLTEVEVQQLITQGNRSTDWNHVLVSDPFYPALIRNSEFYGLVRIGKMEETYLEYRDLRLQSGIYDSQVISSDIGDFCAIHHVRYLGHFILGTEVVLFNVNELQTSANAKFGNGIVKEGDDPSGRIVLELRNENGGRTAVPFDGMCAADVFLWTNHPADAVLQQRLLEMTERQFSKRCGFYSTIGDRTVIKNSDTIKNVKIGSDAYIKGINKLKNVTVNSSQDSFTQIGEGCELVNGIIGYGCRVFYGVKAVRFVLSSHSQLKYGARLINAVLGENSTISCCEVLNSVIFPAHEQHHNNSFLCASLLMGQSNMAAGATVGSNHNSRAADGEIIAGRGFWPGLCVSLKHNSRFASYTLIVKGDFLYELDIRMPFSLVSNDLKNDRLVIVPGYWFMYNMYALLRNTSKFTSRDKRKNKELKFEYAVLAPDSVNELLDAQSEIESTVRKMGETYWEKFCREGEVFDAEVSLDHVENSTRRVVLRKPREAYVLFRRLVRFYVAETLVAYIQQYSLASLLGRLSVEMFERHEFVNLGGQLVTQSDYRALLHAIKVEEINSWAEVHAAYRALSDQYDSRKLEHAVASLVQLEGREASDWSTDFLSELFEEALSTKQWMCDEVRRSRAKDYDDYFRDMVYDSAEERNQVIGSLDDNAFIQAQVAELELFREEIVAIRSTFQKSAKG